MKDFAKNSNLKVIFERKNYKGKQQIVTNTRTKQFFWRRLANNGNELSRSSETYNTLAGCLNGIKADAVNAQSWVGHITKVAVKLWK